MKYVFPISVDRASAEALLGTIPRTATQTRIELARKIESLVGEYVAAKSERVEEIADAEPSKKKKTAKK